MKIFGILHKVYNKMLGIRQENNMIELDIDTENVWTTIDAEKAKRTIDDPAAWFESTQEYPKHQFKSEDLVAIELSNIGPVDPPKQPEPEIEGYLRSFTTQNDASSMIKLTLEIDVTKMNNINQLSSKIKVFFDA